MKEKVPLSLLMYQAPQTHQFVELSAVSGTMIHVNLRGAGFSKAGSAVVKSRSNRSSKINLFASLCEKLFDENVAAAQIADEKVFVEYKMLDNTSVSATFDGKTISFNGTVPDSYIDTIIPVAVYALSKACPFVETKEVFVELANLINNGGAADQILEKLLTVCDAFYYEAKANGYMNTEIEINDELTDESINEAKRTGVAEPIDVLAAGASYPRTVKSSIISDTENGNAPKKQSTATLFDQIKNGDYIVNTFWDASRRSYIVDLGFLDSYIPNNNFFKIFCKIKSDIDKVLERLDNGLYGDDAIGDNYINIQLVGRPGSGKTVLARAIAAAFGMPIRVVAASKHTEEDTFTGMTKVQQGGFQYVETPFIDGFKNGGIIVLEEYNLADPGVMMGALGQAIEKPFILLEDGYREVKRHPLCIVIATMNSGTMGSREPSEALTSRLPFTKILEDPDEDTFIQILKTHSEASEKECRKVYGIYQKVLAYLNSPQVNEKQVALSITMRHCIEALKQIKLSLPYGTKDQQFREAIADTMIGAIAIKDLELATEVFDAVVKNSK